MLRLQYPQGTRLAFLLVCTETGRDVWVGEDWDFPCVARNFGFVPCDCGETDGTVDCPHKTATDMITAARDWLDDHIGDTCEDPGYLSEER
jgi:hypothetical protein